MGKIISIDYGLKRVGLAYCEDSITIAHPLTTISTSEIWNFLQTYFSENFVHTVVLGLPKKLDTTETNLTSHVIGFKKKLLKTFPSLRIIDVDERFTSKIAKQSMLISGVNKKNRKNKGLVDEIAAVIILQDYLTSLT